VLAVEGHPILPSDKDIRRAIETLAGNLANTGAKVTRESPLLPDFAESSRLYMRMLLSFLGAFFLPEAIAGARVVAAQLSPDDKSLGAERLRGMTQSHRDWVLDEGARGRLRAQWRELFKSFDAVICPIMPTPAYPHDHSAEQESRRVLIDGKPHVYPDQLSWPGIAICLRFSPGSFHRLTKNSPGSQLKTVVLTRMNSTPIQNVGIDNPARASRRAVTSSEVLRLTADRIPSGTATTLDRSMAMTASWIVIGTAWAMSGMTGWRERKEKPRSP